MPPVVGWAHRRTAANLRTEKPFFGGWVYFFCKHKSFGCARWVRRYRRWGGTCLYFFRILDFYFTRCNKNNSLGYIVDEECVQFHPPSKHIYVPNHVTPPRT